MEFLAELLLEVLGEVFLENGMEAASDRRRPMWLRVLILGVLGLFFAAVLAILVIVGVGVFSESPLISIFLTALSAVWIFLGVRRLRKILRTFSRK